MPRAKCAYKWAKIIQKLHYVQGNGFARRGVLGNIAKMSRVGQICIEMLINFHEDLIILKWKCGELYWRFFVFVILKRNWEKLTFTALPITSKQEMELEATGLPSKKWVTVPGSNVGDLRLASRNPLKQFSRPVEGEPGPSQTPSPRPKELIASHSTLPVQQSREHISWEAIRHRRRVFKSRSDGLEALTEKGFVHF